MAEVLKLGRRVVARPGGLTRDLFTILGRVVWCGVAWSGAVWCDMVVWCAMLWCCVVLFGVVLFGRAPEEER